MYQTSAVVKLVAGVALAGWTALLFASAAELDEVTLKNGRKYVGTIVSDSPESLILSIDGGTVEIPRNSVQSPPYFGPERPAAPELDSDTPPRAAPVAEHPLPGVRPTLDWLRSFAWSTPVRQIPARVTDRGRWPFLPATSFWAGDFFQLSFFGDPEKPAAIEVSLPQDTEEAWKAKGRLLELMLGLVPGLAVDNRFATLNIRGDSFAVGDLWFAIAGPASAAAPGRWTVVIMHERSLTPARASLEELEAISEPVARAVIDPNQPRSWQSGSWTPDELEWLNRNAPPAAPPPDLDQVASANEAQVRQWLAVNSARVFVPSFARIRGRYLRTETDWLAPQ